MNEKNPGGTIFEDGAPLLPDEALEDQIKSEVKELAIDLAALPFEIWNLLNPKVDKLTDREKDLLSGPLAGLLTKWGFTRLDKDELKLLIYGGLIISKRLAQSRKVKSQTISVPKPGPVPGPGSGPVPGPGSGPVPGP